MGVVVLGVVVAVDWSYRSMCLSVHVAIGDVGPYVGGVGRCYPFFKDLEACVLAEPKRHDVTKCLPLQEDYLECLHHFKEKTQHQAVLDARKAGGTTTTAT